MKKLLLILVTLPLLWACGGDDKPVQKVWNPDKMVLIKPDKTAFKTVATKGDAETSEHLSALEIVKQADILRFMATYSENIKLEKDEVSRIGIADIQKDLEKPAIKFWSSYIIYENELIKDFTHAYDVVICNQKNDTIAYISNQNLINSREPLKKAFEEQRYEDVYKMFDELYTFKPITGAEWRALKEQGDL